MRQLHVLVGGDDLWHTLTPAQMATLAGLSQVRVAYHDAHDENYEGQLILASQPLAAGCATDVVVRVTHLSLPHILDTCTRAVRLQQVVIALAFGGDKPGTCVLTQKLGAQLPAHLVIVLSASALSHPTAIQVAMTLLRTRPATSVTDSFVVDPASTHHPRRRGCGQAEPRSSHVEVLELQECKCHNMHTAAAACAALVYQHVQARFVHAQWAAELELEKSLQEQRQEVGALQEVGEQLGGEALWRREQSRRNKIRKEKVRIMTTGCSSTSGTACGMLMKRLGA